MELFWNGYGVLTRLNYAMIGARRKTRAMPAAGMNRNHAGHMEEIRMPELDRVEPVIEGDALTDDEILQIVGTALAVVPLPLLGPIPSGCTCEDSS
jgi:hypothetical protein